MWLKCSEIQEKLCSPFAFIMCGRSPSFKIFFSAVLITHTHKRQIFWQWHYLDHIFPLQEQSSLSDHEALIAAKNYVQWREMWNNMNYNGDKFQSLVKECSLDFTLSIILYISLATEIFNNNVLNAEVWRDSF